MKLTVEMTPEEYEAYKGAIERAETAEQHEREMYGRASAVAATLINAVEPAKDSRPENTKYRVKDREELADAVDTARDFLQDWPVGYYHG